MVTMGDSLWVQIYPPSNYIRTYSISSYSETAVDQIIINNVPEEFKRSDWQFMISKFHGNKAKYSP
jgi:hypothetical protein